jgi:hypothetical protein
MLTKNYAIEICNILNEEENEGIDFNIQFRRKGDHKRLAISLFIGRRQFEFNIYNIHHEPVVKETADNILCNSIYSIDAVHPVLKRVVAFNMNFDEIFKLHVKLLEAGYENKNIHLTKEEKKNEN